MKCLKENEPDGLGFTSELRASLIEKQEASPLSASVPPSIRWGRQCESSEAAAGARESTRRSLAVAGGPYSLALTLCFDSHYLD